MTVCVCVCTGAVKVFPLLLCGPGMASGLSQDDVSERTTSKERRITVAHRTPLVLEKKSLFPVDCVKSLCRDSETSSWKATRSVIGTSHEATCLLGVVEVFKRSAATSPML